MTNDALRTIGRSLRRLERALSGSIDLDAVCCGVTMAQVHVLLAVEEAGESRVTALAGELGLDKSTLSRTIESLVRAGLVARRAVPGDRRSVALSLTPLGRKAAADINRQGDREIRALLERIPASKRELVAEAVGHLAEAVRARPSCCRPAAAPARTERSAK
jgi:DNA-binding MarR family transcriptional regulator